MPRAKSTTSTLKAEKALVKELDNLTRQIKKLQNAELIRIYKKPGKFLFFSFMKGIMMGLGSVLGATVVVALLVYLLSKVSFVPIVGEFISDIIGQLEIHQAAETIQ